MSDSYIYVRGIGAAMFRSSNPDVRLLSRSHLQQIDLGKISRVDTGAQAVIPALHCESCDSISFKAS